MSEKQLLTNSRRNSFGACHRKHFFEYELCRRPAVDASALRFGTLVHSCLEAWWSCQDETPERRQLEVDSVLAAVELDVNADVDAFDIAKAHAMMLGYEAMWGGKHAIETIAVEASFRAPLLNPETEAASRTFELAGKIDALAKIDGRLLIVEHKTTSEDVAPESRYWDKLAIDGQVSGYYIGAMALNVEPEGCLYDVMRKPAQKPAQIPELDENGLKVVVDEFGERVMKKDGTPRQSAGDGMTVVSRQETADEYEKRLVEEIMGNLGKYFGRREIARTSDDMAEYLVDMWGAGREIADAERMSRWPRNPRSCSGFGECPYFDVCCGRASIDDNTLFKDTETHRELTAQQEVA